MNVIPQSANRVLANLSATSFERLRPYLQTVELVQEVVLVGAGDRLKHAVFPHSGVIALVVRLASGGTVEVAMVGCESVFGAFAALNGKISLTDAIVKLSGRASMLDVDALRSVAEQSLSFYNTLVRHEQALFVQAQQAAACNAMHPLETRLACWLLRMKDLAGRDNFDFTQDFVAQMNGVRRNSVSTVAHALQLAGVIKYSRGHVEITNLAALKEIACECYQVVNAQCEKLLQHD